MEVLTPRGDLERFFDSLRKSGRSTLFTDYDGTLAPFRREPSEAVPFDGVRDALGEIRRRGTRLIVVSGRAIDDLLPLLRLDRVEIWGSHGRERLLASGQRTTVPIAEAALEALSRAERLLEDAGLTARCETKAGCIAVHHRGLDPKEAERIRQEVTHIWSQAASTSELELKPFDGGLEFQVPGISKGTVIRHVLEEEEGAGDPILAYLGDDLTDEDAFAELRGKGLCVLVRPEFRPTQADLWLQPPSELLDFLERWNVITGDRP